VLAGKQKIAQVLANALPEDWDTDLITHSNDLRDEALSLSFEKGIKVVYGN